MAKLLHFFACVTLEIMSVRMTENGLLTFVETRCTELMNWLGSLCFRLQNISKSSTTMIGQLIPLLLSFPCFKLSHLFFKTAYFLQQRHLVRLGRECAALGGKNYSLQVDNLSLHGSNLFEIKKALSNISRRFEAANRSSY